MRRNIQYDHDWQSLLKNFQIFERRLSDKSPLVEWTPNANTSKGLKRGETGDKTTQQPIGSRVVLIADVAHPMIPSQGRGTMMTWKDDADLAMLVSLHLTEATHGHTPDAGALSEALHAFVAACAERCARVQKCSVQSYMERRSL